MRQSVGFSPTRVCQRPVGGLVIDGSGNATAPLAAGQFILVNIHIDNTAGEAIEGIFASIIFQGDQTQFVGSVVPGSILTEPGILANSLGNIGTGAIKGNTPNPQGFAGDIWLQALAYGSAGGVDGSGSQTADISLFFAVTGASGGELVLFDFGLTTGDVIFAPGGGAIPTTFSGAVVNIPEPGTALLLGLGLLALAGRNRRAE